ncbi:phenylalanine aminomutase (D-beta-phenylalanine forming) [Klebsiella variicola]|uniref:phenylalanine aminomutase (D-beta-phenylalanine forming) n=1 Tax=Klebsiella variicola TaxID=244366 RepID=UPI0013D3F72D|nr:phenylalanine aminomutase (D-beta-phenylalanine forming) [Klebsiella variicola]HBR2692813.1 phenylalanine aminomutase (D-beta-phenylalanine forming) [Klebsiella pneumoniae]HDY8573272.1 phenylalanine aminomutase (D-beta-phenylalanine forming) [Klebsiella pneumoniae]
MNITQHNSTSTGDTFILSPGRNVSLKDFIEFSQFSKKIVASEETRERIAASRRALEKLVKEGSVIYGVNTGMGGFVDHLVPLERAEELQKNLIRGVATNVGERFSDIICRATMFARIISLSRGNSALSLENFDRFIAIYNAGLIPEIPRKGSLGTSGDLGPLAAMARMLTGEGNAWFNGERLAAEDILHQLGLAPLELSYKEGLALINGTSCMVALAALNVIETRSLLEQYASISAFASETLLARIRPFHPDVHQLKPHTGQQKIAEMIWNNLHGTRLAVDDIQLSSELGSRLTNSIKQEDMPIEDAYSIRCTPQILGPVLETIEFVERIVSNELNSSNDNPLITPENGQVFHNGHFHGQYISAAMDYLTIAIITMCNLSDRRIDRLLTSANSNGLPSFLCAENGGLRFGLMGGQFMSSSVTAENRSLATPVSIQTLTTTGDFQDVVSFGLVAARRTAEVLQNTRYVIAFELICAAQAADIRDATKLGNSGRLWYAKVRESVPYLDHDESITPYLEELVSRILGGHS